jgi:hypothetical protein
MDVFSKLLHIAGSVLLAYMFVVFTVPHGWPMTVYETNMQ